MNTHAHGILNRLARTASILLVLFSSNPASPHQEGTAPDAKVGEYRVLFDSFELMEPSGEIGDLNPDIFIEANVQSQSHENIRSLLGQAGDDGTISWLDTPDGSRVQVGTLIY